ncbi:MAG TPA: hypothetical protein VN577_08755 [Terriglobales bacterium]|nr:hypothetical protein [Terriglobales bacterium]
MRNTKKKGATRNSKIKRQRFPKDKIARMWAKGMTIAAIAHSIGRIDKNNPGDPFHSLRNCLYRMHRGYTDNNGCFVRLPHRVSRQRVRACKQAGLRAWA